MPTWFPDHWLQLLLFWGASSRAGLTTPTSAVNSWLASNCRTSSQSIGRLVKLLLIFASSHSSLQSNPDPWSRFLFSCRHERVSKWGLHLDEGTVRLSMSVSLSSLRGDMWRAARNFSVFPIGMQSPISSTERRGGRSAHAWGLPFFTATAVLIPVGKFGIPLGLGTAQSI
jgi:hypothetical protein